MASDKKMCLRGDVTAMIGMVWRRRICLSALVLCLLSPRTSWARSRTDCHGQGRQQHMRIERVRPDVGSPWKARKASFLRRSPPTAAQRIVSTTVQPPDCGAVGDLGRPDFCGPELVWHVEDAAVYQREVAIATRYRYLCVRCWKLYF